VRLCDAEASTLNMVAEKMRAHSDNVYSVGFMLDAHGMKIVSSSDDKNIKVWGGLMRFASMLLL
jgi:hypothetical protein